MLLKANAFVQLYTEGNHGEEITCSSNPLYLILKV